MNVVGQLHSGSRPQGPECLIARRNRHVRSCSRSLANAAVNQVAVSSVSSRTFISSAVNGSATAQISAVPTQHVSASRAAAATTTSQHYSPYIQPQRQQQQQQQPPSLQQQQNDSAGRPPRPHHDHQQQQQRQHVDMLAVDHPELVTAAIRGARSIAQLQQLVHKHGTRLNHIHVSAAFVQLQRLWNSSSSSVAGSNGSSTRSSALDPEADYVAQKSLLLQLQQLARSLQRVDGRYCANVLHSLAAIKQQGEPAAYYSTLVDQLCAASFGLVNSMPPQELATLVWSFAMLDTLPAPQLLNRLVANLLRRLAALSPQDLVMTLSGLPRLTQQQQVSPYSTIHKLAAAAAQQMHVASPLECSLLLLTLANVTYQPNAAWLNNYYAASEPKLRDMCASSLGMLGLGLGQMSPLAEAPPEHWLMQYEQQLTTVCIHGQQQHQQQLYKQQQHQQQQQRREDYSSSSSSSSSDIVLQQPAALVELVMGLYGWSRAAPRQPPSPEFQQLVFSTTQYVMDTTTSSSNSSSLTVQQRQRQQQQQHWQQGQFGTLQQLQQQSVVSLHTSIPQYWQQSVIQQQQQLECHQSDHQISRTGGMSPRLLVELLSAAARWRLVPPRSWLLSALRHLHQHLTAGECSNRDIANLLWALATLGVKPNAAWLDGCALALQQHYQQQLAALKQQQNQQQQRPWRREGGLPAASVDDESWQQQQQQQSSQAKQLSLCLWSFNQLQHHVVSADFWQSVWSTSQPLFTKKFRLTDIAMTLEGVKQQQQQPPGWWTMAALKAAVKKAAGAAAELQSQPAADSKQQQQVRSKRKKRRPHDGVLVSSADTVLSDMLRVCAAAAGLGAVPGHKWCDSVVRAVQLAAAAQGQLDLQSLCLFIWSLGKLGYRPSGSSLAPWLAAAVSERREFAQYSSQQLLLLLSGLRYSRVVMNGSWIIQLMTFTQTHAEELPLQVLVQILLYISSTRLRPPAEWAAAMAGALEAAAGQQQQQLDAHQLWLESLLGALVRLHIVPSGRLMQQLEQCAAAAAAGGTGLQNVEKVQQRLQRLRSLHGEAASHNQQPLQAAVQQQQGSQVHKDVQAAAVANKSVNASDAGSHQLSYQIGADSHSNNAVDSRSATRSDASASSNHENSSSSTNGSSSSSNINGSEWKQTLLTVDAGITSGNTEKEKKDAEVSTPSNAAAGHGVRL